MRQQSCSQLYCTIYTIICTAYTIFIMMHTLARSYTYIQGRRSRRRALSRPASSSSASNIRLSPLVYVYKRLECSCIRLDASYIRLESSRLLWYSYIDSLIFVHIRQAVEQKGVVPSRPLLEWYQHTSRALYIRLEPSYIRMFTSGYLLYTIRTPLIFVYIRLGLLWYSFIYGRRSRKRVWCPRGSFLSGTSTTTSAPSSILRSNQTPPEPPFWPPAMCT